MLSDSEQRRLAEIESALQAEDPVLAQRFTSWPRRLAALVVLALAAAVVFTAVAVVRGSVLPAVVGLTTIGAIAGGWLSHRTRSGSRPRG